VVIEEVPILSWKKPAVGSEGDETAAWFETAEGFDEGGLQELFVGQVFEEVAGEDDVERGVLEGPGLTAVLRKEVNVGVQSVRGGRIEIHGELACRRDRVDELSVAAAEVEYGVVGADPLREEL